MPNAERYEFVLKNLQRYPKTRAMKELLKTYPHLITEQEKVYMVTGINPDGSGNC